jgi:hypothetical protein
MELVIELGEVDEAALTELCQRYFVRELAVFGISGAGSDECRK